MPAKHTLKLSLMLDTLFPFKGFSYMHYSTLINTTGTLINTTSSYKYLGVNLDSSLNLESHFDKIYKRAAGRFNLLRESDF